MRIPAASAQTSLRSPNFPERMAKTAQILSRLNEKVFDFFDFAVKQFCGSSLAVGPGGTEQMPLSGS
jgi:hypothetical protein